MPKLVLTDKEKVNLELYINFIIHNSNPCASCDWRSRMECCGCPSGNEYQKKLKKYDVTDLLNHKEIKEYVDASVKLNNYRAKIQSLTNDVHNLEKKIGEIMDNADLVKEPDDKTEFFCNKCKIAFDGEGGIKANTHLYYPCPKCTKICWHSND